MKTEPVAVGAALTVFANAVIAMIVLVGFWDGTPDQIAGVNLVVVTFVGLVTSVVARSKVSPF